MVRAEDLQPVRAEDLQPVDDAVSILSPIEFSAIHLPGAPPFAESSRNPATSDPEACDPDEMVKERCFVACTEHRKDMVCKLLRRRVMCELERARVAVIETDSSASSNAAALDNEVSHIDIALASLPPPLLPNSGVHGNKTTKAVETCSAGQSAQLTPSVPLSADVEALLQHQLQVRSKLAPLHTYLGSIASSHATHSHALLHEALWCAPTHAMAHAEALRSSPLPRPLDLKEQFAARVADATRSVREQSGGQGSRPEASLGTREFESLHCDQSEAESHTVPGPTAPQLASAANAAVHSSAFERRAAAALALTAARGRLRFAESRREDLRIAAYTCPLVVGDDVHVTAESRRVDETAQVPPPPPPPPVPAPAPVPATVVSVPGDDTDPNGSYSILSDGRSRIVRRRDLRAVRPEAEYLTDKEHSAALQAVHLAEAAAAVMATAYMFQGSDIGDTGEKICKQTLRSSGHLQLICQDSVRTAEQLQQQLWLEKQPPSEPQLAAVIQLVREPSSTKALSALLAAFNTKASLSDHPSRRTTAAIKSFALGGRNRKSDAELASLFSPQETWLPWSGRQKMNESSSHAMAGAIANTCTSACSHGMSQLSSMAAGFVAAESSAGHPASERDQRTPVRAKAANGSRSIGESFSDLATQSSMLTLLQLRGLRLKILAHINWSHAAVRYLVIDEALMQAQESRVREGVIGSCAVPASSATAESVDSSFSHPSDPLDLLTLGLRGMGCEEEATAAMPALDVIEAERGVPLVPGAPGAVPARAPTRDVMKGRRDGVASAPRANERTAAPYGGEISCSEKQGDLTNEAAQRSGHRKVHSTAKEPSASKGMTALGEVHLLGPTTPLVTSLDGSRRILYDAALVDLRSLEEEMAVKASALIRLHVEARIAQCAASQVKAIRSATECLPGRPSHDSCSGQSVEGVGAGAALFSSRGESSRRPFDLTPPAAESNRPYLPPASIPSATPRRVESRLVDADVAATAPSIAAQADEEMASNGQFAAEARAEVDAGELLLQIFSAELSFQAARTRLLAAHLALVPDCATPSERAQLRMRVNSLFLLRPIAVPSERPLATGAAPITLTHSISSSAHPVAVASGAAIAASARLHTTAAWMVGRGAAAQAEAMELEAALMLKLFSTCKRYGRVAHPVNAPATDDAVAERAALHDARSACSVSTQLALGTEPLSSAGSSCVEHDRGHHSSSELTNRGGAFVHAAGATNDLIGHILMLNVCVEASAASLEALPFRLSRGLSSPGMRLAILRHAETEFPKFADAAEAQAHDLDVLSEYSDTVRPPLANSLSSFPRLNPVITGVPAFFQGFLGNWPALSAALVELSEERDSGRSVGLVRHRGASRASDEHTIEVLCRAFTVAEHLSCVHTALVSTRQLTLLQIRQDELLKPLEHSPTKMALDKQDDDDARVNRAYVAAACRRCALAEADESLCDFAPREPRWWQKSLLGGKEHAVVVAELHTALRLQRSLQLALSTLTCHNACAIDAVLLAIADSLSEAATSKPQMDRAQESFHSPGTTRDGSVEVTDAEHRALGWSSKTRPFAGRRDEPHLSTRIPATVTGSMGICDDTETEGEATSHQRCHVPMLLLCPPPPYEVLAAEEKFASGLSRSLSEYLPSCSGPSSSTPWKWRNFAWGNFLPKVAEELSRQVSQLWLSSNMLDQDCDAMLQQRWNESAVTVRHPPPSLGSSATAFSTRAAIHETLHRYCSQLQDTTRMRLVRVWAAIVCASVASSLGDHLLKPLASLDYLVSQRAGAINVPAKVEATNKSTFEGGTGCSGAGQGNGGDRCAAAASGPDAIGGRCSSPVDDGASCVTACACARRVGVGRAQISHGAVLGDMPSPTGVFASGVLPSATSAAPRDADGLASVINPTWFLPDARQFLSTKRQTDLSPRTRERGLADQRDAHELKDFDAKVSASAILLQFLPLIRIRALLGSHSDARPSSGSLMAASGGIITETCPANTSDAQKTLEHGATRTSGVAVGRGFDAFHSDSCSEDAVANFSSKSSSGPPLQPEPLHPRPSAPPCCLDEMSPSAPIAVVQVLSF